MHVVLCLLLSLGAAALGGPTPQNYFPASQYIASAPGYPALQFNPVKQQPYLQQLASQYVPAPQQAPVYEGAPQTYLQQYTQQQQPQPIQQVLLPSAVDRQVQRVAQQVAGPGFAQQVQAAQQQAQAQEALAAAQRKSTSTTFSNRPVQPIPIPQPPPAPQVISEGQTQNRPYYRPAAQGFKPAPPPSIPIQSERLAKPERREEEDDEFDHNPNYQFGFDVKDDLYTNYQNRKEQRDGDKISGSYSVVDADGFVRVVKYTADPKEGFKAEVTRQPTDIVVKSPKQVQEEQQSSQYRYQGAPSSKQEQQEPRQNAIYQYE